MQLCSMVASHCFVCNSLGPEADGGISVASSAEPKTIPYAKAASLLRQYGSQRALHEGRSLHAYIAKRGFDQETFLGNLLVQMYGKCGSVEEAQRAFDRILEPNVFSWTIMVAAYAENGHLQEARRMFDSMPKRNVVSWTAMVATYAQSGYLQEARNLFEEMPVRNAVSWNAMIAGYAQNGQLHEALKVYRMMRQEGVQPNDSTFVSTVDACANLAAVAAGKSVHANVVEMGYQRWVKVGNALINMYGNCGCSEDAKNVFDEMQDRDVITWTALVVAYAKNGHLQDAKWAFDEMPQRSVVSWSAMIAAYAQHGHNKEALSLFRKMDMEGQQPDGVTFITIFDVCGNLSALAEGKIIYEDIVDTELEMDVTVATSLLNMFSKCGSLHDAKRLFDKMPQKDMVMWTSMISAYAQNGEWLKALDTFCLMGLEGVKPNEVTFMSVLSACSHAGLLRDGWQQFVSMRRDYKISPELRHYVCMIDLLARAGELRDAEDLVHNMPFEPDGLSWRTLLSACKVNPEMEQGARAAENVFELDPEHGAPYVLLSSIHADK